MKLLITGGAGFIGSNYLRQIISGDLSGISEITVVDKLTYAGNLKNFESLPEDSFNFVEADICDVELMNKLVSSHEAIVNFAAESHVDRSISSVENFVATNVAGTANLLTLANKHSVSKFVQISTDEVYGSIEQGSWSEMEPLLPNSPYSATKASADLMCRSFFQTYGLNVSITRASNNYGPSQYPEKLIPLAITNLLLGESVPIYGTGLNVRDWIFVKDHCNAIHQVLLRGNAGEIYNIGGGQELSNIHIVKLIMEILGVSDSRIKFVADRLGHDWRYSVDTQKIENDLAFKTKVSLEAGLKETISWYETNRDFWLPLREKIAKNG
jgi:dTDP-glucose 4,6-dehydratase